MKETIKKEEKSCMVQFVRSTMFGSMEIALDTGLITRREAIELWLKNKYEVIRRIKNKDENIVFVIWVNCSTDTCYGESILYIDSSMETDGNRIWKTKKEYSDMNFEKEIL